MDTHIGIFFITTIITGEWDSVLRTDQCNPILCMDMIIAYAKQNFIYTLKMSF